MLGPEGKLPDWGLKWSHGWKHLVLYRLHGCEIGGDPPCLTRDLVDGTRATRTDEADWLAEAPERRRNVDRGLQWGTRRTAMVQRWVGRVEADWSLDSDRLLGLNQRRGLLGCPANGSIPNLLHRPTCWDASDVMGCRLIVVGRSKFGVWMEED